MLSSLLMFFLERLLPRELLDLESQRAAVAAALAEDPLTRAPRD